MGKKAHERISRNFHHLLFCSDAFSGSLIRNAWVLIAVLLSAGTTVLYFQQEKIDALEKQLEQLENKG